jgi:hypothetical protein
MVREREKAEEVREGRRVLVSAKGRRVKKGKERRIEQQGHKFGKALQKCIDGNDGEDE